MTTEIMDPAPPARRWGIADAPAAGDTLANARKQLRRAVDLLGLDEAVYDMLAVPRRETTVSIPLRRDDGTVEVLTGHRVQHNFSRCRLRAACGSLRVSTSTRCVR